MPSWISPSELERPRLAAALVVGSILGLAGAGGICPAGASEAWFTAAAGHEDDVTAALDLKLDPVAGGSFLQFSGGVAQRFGWRRPLHVNLQGSWQRFVEPSRRRLGAGAIGADWRLGLGRHWDLRPSATGFFLEDTARREARQIGAGGDLALVRRGDRLDLELRGGWEDRRYPRLDLQGSDGVVRSHQERRLAVGPGVTWRPARTFTASASVTGAWADAPESWYDAHETTVLAAARWRVRPHARLLVHGYSRSRRFIDRASGGDADLTQQVGIAAEWDLGRSLTASLGWVGTRYRDPLQAHQNLDRVSLAVTGRFGSVLRLPAAASSPASGTEPSVPTLRVRAPAARVVAVVGDFNGWNPAADPLVRGPDGWWSVVLHLPAGVYQYSFWIDGELVPPAGDAATVPDGFGGRNGVLVVPQRSL